MDGKRAKGTKGQRSNGTTDDKGDKRDKGINGWMMKHR